MDVDFSLKGFDDLEKVLNTLPTRTEKLVVMQSLRAGGRVIIREAKKRVPEDQGILKKSFMTRAGKVKPGSALTLIVATKGGGKFGWYAHLVEFGTSKSRARPFFRPAFDENPEAILEAIGSTMAKAIPRAIAKGAT